MTKTYRAITGRRYDLEGLTAEERAFFGEVMALYRTRPDWTHFTREWMALARRTVWKGTRVPVGAVVYRVCQDLAARLGIAEGRVAPPDYRDRIADLIDERFRSRYEFCKQTGIDEGHLSRVLGSQKHLAPATLFEVLDALGVEIELVDRDEVFDAGARPLEPETPFARLTDAQRQLGRVRALKARATGPRGRRVPATELGLPDLLRARVEAGEPLDEVLDGEVQRLLAETVDLAREIAADAERERRLAAS